jgi:hypothetical protein
VTGRQFKSDRPLNRVQVVKKFKLKSASSSSDFTMIGITCQLKNYRLALGINKKLNFSFRRIEDLLIQDGESERSYAFYLYEDKDERRNYFLVQNQHPEGRLEPSQKAIDYFLIADDILEDSKMAHILQGLKKVEQVLAAFLINPEKLKNPDIIFEEIEMHMLGK